MWQTPPSAIRHVNSNPHGLLWPCVFNTRGQCATWLKRQPRVYYTWLTCRGVVGVPRGKLYNSQQLDLPRLPHVANYTWLTVCHVYISGDLQIFL